MTRTTLRMDERILGQLKRLAVEENRSLTALVDELLREGMLRRKRRVREKSPPLPVYGIGGPAPGVDLTSARAMFEFAEASLPLEKRG